MHMFRDIRQKGVTRNYTTKYNEKEHGPLRLYYRFQTNFKAVNQQVMFIIWVQTCYFSETDNTLFKLSKIDEAHLISISIRTELDAIDEYHAYHMHNSQQNDDLDRNMEDTVLGHATHRHQKTNTHISVGAKMPPTTLRDVEIKATTDPAFRLFRNRVNERLSVILDHVGIDLQDRHEVSIPYITCG